MTDVTAPPSAGPSGLLADLLDLPTEAHKSDFVISLTDSVHRAERTLSTYVVTPQLADVYRGALSLVCTAVDENVSKGAWLHSSFGGGKSHFMSVLTLTLEGHPGTRAKEGLAEVIGQFESRLTGRRLLVVPLNMIGAASVDAAVLGGYVKRVAELHPEAPVPAVYLADGLLADAVSLRSKMGDDSFFAALAGSPPAAGGGGWGKLASSWDAISFDAAVAAPVDSTERRKLVGNLVTAFFSSVQSAAQSTGDGLVTLDEGLGIISRHAKDLDYDGIVLMLDEVVLWFATQMADEMFVKREGPKIAKLVESGATSRPVPIVTFIARQKDLRDLVGEGVTHAEQLNLSTILSWWEGRFDTLNLEMDNLRAIVQRRLLTPKSQIADAELDRAFQTTTGAAGVKVIDTLCTSSADRTDFRRVYPFSPALISAVVDLSSVLQRERTALRVLAQLLAERRETMRVGDLVPLGDLYDVIASGDEPFGSQIRQYWETARRLYASKLRPMLLGFHQLDEAAAAGVGRDQPFTTDDRLIKTLLLASLVPGSATLGSMTARRLGALNHGTIKSPIPGQEHAVVIERLRRWAGEVGEISLSDDPNDPTVIIRLSGVDTDRILSQAAASDSAGARRRKLREMLFSSIGVEDGSGLFPTRTVLWKGTRRVVDVVYGNLADVNDVTEAAMPASGDRVKVIIDFPFDDDRPSPADDLARVESYVSDHPSTPTLCWIPQFLSRRSLDDLGMLVIHDHVLSGDNFDRYASHLSVQDRPTARDLLRNRRDGLRDRIGVAMRQAYRIDEPQDGTVEPSLTAEQQFSTLAHHFQPRRPTAAGLQDAFDKLVGQLLTHRHPAHPDFDDEIRNPDLKAVLTEVTRAAELRAGRIDIAGTPLRRTMKRIANPLQLGTMYEAHYEPASYWGDWIARRIAEETPAVVTVGLLRSWLESPHSRGLTREVQDLVVLSIAVMTDRVLMRHGEVVAGEIGRLDDSTELHTQNLPDAATWTAAANRAAVVFGSTASPVVTAAGVARLVGDVRKKALEARRPAIELIDALLPRLSQRGLGDQVHRALTAAAGRSLIEAISTAANDAELIRLVAAATVPTTEAALGSSIVNAAKVVGALRSTNWDLIATASNLGGSFATEAAALRVQVDQALSDDQFVSDLAGALARSERGATDLVGRATAAVAPLPEAPPLAPTPLPSAADPSIASVPAASGARLAAAERSSSSAVAGVEPPDDDEEVVTHDDLHGLRRDEALDRLDTLRQRLLAAASDPAELTVDLSWTVRRSGTRS